MEPHNQHSSVGIVWYTKEEWQKMKEMSSDAEIFENSFKEWEQMANKSLLDLKATGIIAKRVFIKADEFIVWCKIYSLPLDASSRSKYITEIMSKMNSN